METLRSILEHPIMNMATALILIITSIAEGWEEFTNHLNEFHLGVHHGVLLLGLIMLLRGVLEALDSVIEIQERLK